MQFTINFTSPEIWSDILQPGTRLKSKIKIKKTNCFIELRADKNLTALPIRQAMIPATHDCTDSKAMSVHVKGELDQTRRDNTVHD